MPLVQLVIQAQRRERVEGLLPEQVGLAGLAIRRERSLGDEGADAGAVAEAQVASGFLGRQPAVVVPRQEVGLVVGVRGSPVTRGGETGLQRLDPQGRLSGQVLEVRAGPRRVQHRIAGTLGGWGIRRRVGRWTSRDMAAFEQGRVVAQLLPCLVGRQLVGIGFCRVHGCLCGGKVGRTVDFAAARPLAIGAKAAAGQERAMALMQTLPQTVAGVQPNQQVVGGTVGHLQPRAPRA